MKQELADKLAYVKDVLKQAEIYEHAAHIINFDLETICPPAAMEEQGEVAALMTNQAFRLLKQEEFIRACEDIFRDREELDEYDRRMAQMLHRTYLKTKNITPEMDHEFAKILNRAYVRWIEAKEADDYPKFAPSLEEVRDVCLKKAELKEYDPGEEPACLYDSMLSEYEFGITEADLDACFARCKERLLPFLRKILASKKVIRTDFLSRKVTDDQQKVMAQYLLEVMRYDFTRGAFTTTEHPFTDSLGRNDTRVTTHYHEDAFAASMYSIVHEGGHALFDQLTPARDRDHYIEDMKTMGMHESVSRFYENRIGRSREFVHLIYPKVCEIFPQVMNDVSENELYEALNLVQPSFIRTEADEFTYTLHIIIRYEIEKEIMSGRAAIEDLPKLWNDKYEEYLGIRPEHNREGILQDVHWSFGFGYFPTYAIGNMYNAMYLNRMKEEIDFSEAVAAGDFEKINGWMQEHVFAKADMLSPKEWIRDITGRDFTPDDFLDYLEEKYGELYEIS